MKVNKRVFLFGFMTSGKTTLGKILANVLGWNFIDLDKVIVEKEKMSINEIFENKGEDYFRKLEKDLLFEVATEDNVVISLGGGTLNSHETVDFINRNGITIYLKVSPENLYKRLKNKIDRPLFRDLVLNEDADKEEFIKRIKILLGKREIFYNKAKIIITTDSQRIGKTVDIIASKLRKFIDE